MILIDSSFWGNVGVASNDGNAAGNQYDFYNYIDMANGEVVRNQYEFFKESAVDGVYYDTPDDWYEAVGTLYSEPITDEYSFYQNVTFDGVNPVGNQYEFFKFLTDAISGIFNLSSALHEWNYQNATDVGTTVTMPDTGSIGTLPTANPDAASEPTLGANSISFDGIAEFLQNLTSNFRGADTSGVVHVLIDFVSDGNNQQFFSLADNTVTNERMGFGLGGGNTIQMFMDIGGSVTILKTTATISNGLVLLSYYCTGSDNFICIDALKQTAYGTDTIGSSWIKTTIDGGNSYNNIAISSIQRSTPNYYATNIKYIAYTPFTTEAAVLVDANKILNSGI